MRRNVRTCVRGKNVILMPYKQCMVPKYHEWMQCPDLLQLTASEPLTLEEEYEMQKKWMDDDDKCTFIILDLDSYEKTKDEIGSMIGDTNLFVIDYDNNSLLTAEAEIMIAEAWARGQRRGWEAMILMLLYGIIELKVQQYQAKICINNFSSLQMFTKLGFEEVSQSDIFQEITMVKAVADEWIKWLKGQTLMNIIKIDDTLKNEREVAIMLALTNTATNATNVTATNATATNATALYAYCLFLSHGISPIENVVLKHLYKDDRPVEENGQNIKKV